MVLPIRLAIKFVSMSVRIDPIGHAQENSSTGTIHPRIVGGLVKLIDAQPRQPHRLGALEDFFGLRATRRISLGPGLLSRER
jgi:hypothetical protein